VKILEVLLDHYVTLTFDISTSKLASKVQVIRQNLPDNSLALGSFRLSVSQLKTVTGQTNRQTDRQTRSNRSWGLLAGESHNNVSQTQWLACNRAACKLLFMPCKPVHSRLLTDSLCYIGEQHSVTEIGLKVGDKTIRVSSFHQVMVRPVAVDLP